MVVRVTVVVVVVLVVVVVELLVTPLFSLSVWASKWFCFAVFLCVYDCASACLRAVRGLSRSV